ncbi:MAG: porin [Hyphomicrobiaceae bacterium]
MFGGLLKTTSLAALLAAGMAFGGASAKAADLGGDCCADLEERVAELEATTARKGNRKVSLTVSGWVNEAMMFWDDGVESNIYQVGNNVAQTRFRFVGSAKISADWSAGYLLEVGVLSANSATVTAANDDGGNPNTLGIRHSAWWLASKQLGKVWVGQTSAATDGIMEINLAGVSHFATQNMAAQVGHFQVRNANGTLSGNQLREYMGAPFNGGNTAAQIGEGERHNVVKYESPTLAGFVLSAAYGEDDMWDVALRYAGEFSGFKLAMGVGYMQWTEGTNNEYFCAPNGASDASCNQIGVSGAIMHVPTGLYAHAAYGIRTQDANFGVLDDQSTQLYVQAGIEQKFFPLGKTTIFGEYQQWDIGAQNTLASNVAGDAASRSGELTMWGIGLNQNIEAAAMDLYIRYNNFDAETTSLVTGTTRGYDTFQSVIMGGRIQF